MDRKSSVAGFAALLWWTLAVMAFPYQSKAQALSGTYTIGGTGASYSSFANAVSALTSKGISSAVIFNVAPGNYNETITIPAIKGADSVNTITFNGAGISSGGTRIYYNLTSSGSSIIYLDQASWVTLENMTVENTSTATTPVPASLQLAGKYSSCFTTAFLSPLFLSL